MMLPGPNQTHSSQRRHRIPPSERYFLERPAPVRTMAQAIAAGLQLDPEAREAGYADGAAGKSWDPGQLEILSYSSGYVDGTKFGRTKRS